MITIRLHWSKDPLLIDPEPFEQNNWLTANDLFENDHRDKIFNSIDQFQLYSIVVRKIDFITGERLLQSFPYILLNDMRIKNLRKNTLSLAERTYYYFEGTKADHSICFWQKKINNYLEEQKRLPFPLFRLYPDWLEIYEGNQFLSFQSARGEGFQLPLYLTDELTYLSGVIMGDGHLANYFINIIDSSKEHIVSLTKILEEMFHSKTEFFKQSNAEAWNVNILGKWIVRFFNFLTGQPINKRKYPSLREPLIFQNNELFRRKFWQGVMDADGSYKTNISFTSASQNLFFDFTNFLEQNKLDFKVYTNRLYGAKTYSLNLDGLSRKIFSTLIGTNHPQKKQELEQLLKRKIYPFSPRAYTLMKQGTWVGRVESFQEESFIEGFFDFTKVPYFCVSNLGLFLKELRSNLTQREFAEKLSINHGKLSQYERNVIAVPTSILKEIFLQTNHSIPNFLRNNPKLAIQARKSKCLLDTKPTPYLLELLQGIQVKEKKYLQFIGRNNQIFEEYKEEFCIYFSIDIPQKRFFRNAVLYAFIKEFCMLK